MVALTVFTLVPLMLTFFIAQTQFQVPGRQYGSGSKNYEVMSERPALWTSGRNSAVYAKFVGADETPAGAGAGVDAKSGDVAFGVLPTVFYLPF